jgi:hypothetical protein
MLPSGLLKLWRGVSRGGGPRVPTLCHVPPRVIDHRKDIAIWNVLTTPPPIICLIVLLDFLTNIRFYVIFVSN